MVPYGGGRVAHRGRSRREARLLETVVHDPDFGTIRGPVPRYDRQPLGTPL